jgi:hypothetical protein
MANIDNLVQHLAEGVAPVKPAPHPFVVSLGLTLAAALYLAVALVAAGPRADLAHQLHAPWFVAELVLLFVTFATSALGAALLAYPDLHQRRRAAFAPVWSFALFVVVLILAWRANPHAPPPVHNFQCTISISLVAVLPGVWTFYALRRLASTHQRLAGAVAALSAFSVGALWLRLHEVNDSIAHVVEWHYLPMLAVGLVGAWLGKRLLRW